MSKTLLPNVMWAQRSDRVYLTIDLQDTADSKPEISLSNDAEGKHGHLSFKGKGQSHATGSDAHNYALELDLYGPINVEESKVRVTGRGIVLVVQKQEKSDEHWPRLLKESGKLPRNIKVDWSKWVDEDEEDEKPDNFDMSDMQNLQQFGGGKGGMPGMPDFGGAGGMPGMPNFGGGAGGMPNFGGAGGMPGGMNFEDLGDEGEGADDSDDDDVPELEAKT